MPGKFNANNVSFCTNDSVGEGSSGSSLQLTNEQVSKLISLLQARFVNLSNVQMACGIYSYSV